MLRFWGEQAPFLRKNGLDVGKTCSVFGMNRLRFWDKQAPSLGQNGFVLVKKWLGLGVSVAVNVSLSVGSSLCQVCVKSVSSLCFCSYEV